MTTPAVTPASTVWRDLRTALCDAHAGGAEIRFVGATVEIEGIPETLRAALPESLLWDYLGAARADNEALDFLDRLGVTAELVTRRDAVDAVLAAHDGANLIGLDIETSPPGARPVPVRLTKDGTLAARQPKPNTDGLDPYRAEIMTLQLYGGGDQCFVLHGEALAELLSRSWLWEQRLVVHNAAFELSFLQHHSRLAQGTAARHPIECTMQAAGLLLGVKNRRLVDAAGPLLGVEPPKALQTSCWAAPQLSPGQVAYAATDAVLALRLWHVVRPVLEAKGRLAAYELQRDAIPAVVDMELRGLGFDRAEHARQVDSWVRELADAQREYQQLTGKRPPSTPAELREWVTEVAGDFLVGWPRSPKKGELSVAAKDVFRLAAEPGARPVLRIRALQKLISTFGPKLAGLINPVTGRLHGSFNIARAKSGRFTASGPNLQQLPSTRAPDFKRIIKAGPGNLLVCGDYNQLEMRVAAALSFDPALTAVFAEGRDLHTETAALIAGVPIDQVTKEQRQAAKAVNFGSIYGMGPRSLAEYAFAAYGVDMTVSAAREALDRFFRTYSALLRWMRQHAAVCRARGYVEIGVGRVVAAAWEAAGRLSFPQCCNLPVQGAAADVMLLALQMVFNRLRGIRGGLVATVHDEILLAIAEADAEAARLILEETMIEAFALTFPTAPLTGLVTAKIGPTWRSAK